MPRPKRLLFPYGFYHLTSRGVDGRLIFLDDGDRLLFVLLLERVMHRFGWKLHAYCLLGNHYHLIVECSQPALSAGMQRLNGLYAANFNARYRRVGHLFQRRFESKRIDDEAYLEEARRYVVENALRHGLCTRADAWPWGGLRLRVPRPSPPARRPLQPPVATLPRPAARRPETPPSPPVERRRSATMVRPRAGSRARRSPSCSQAPRAPPRSEPVSGASLQPDPIALTRVNRT